MMQFQSPAISPGEHRCETTYLFSQDRRVGFLEGWTIEDEQWQEIGGGYEAVKFRFLLFL
jgi:hypothetical protein